MTAETHENLDNVQTANVNGPLEQEEPYLQQAGSRADSAGSHSAAACAPLQTPRSAAG
jgi:hypothetical protein